MSKDFNISMICFILNWFFYDPSWMLHLSEFLWTLRSSVLVVFNNFLLIDETDRIEISSDQKRFFIALSLYPLSFFANTPFNNVEDIVFFFDNFYMFSFRRYAPVTFEDIYLKKNYNHEYLTLDQTKVFSVPLWKGHLTEIPFKLRLQSHYFHTKEDSILIKMEILSFPPCFPCYLL